MVPNSAFLAVRGAGTAHASAARALRWATTLWFLVTVAGQLAFAAYIVALYGGALLRGHSGQWNTVMTHGHVDGDPAGNAATIAHVRSQVKLIPRRD